MDLKYAPSLVLPLIEGLPHGSMTRALHSGGMDLLGWDETRFILANLYNALNLNTRASGNWGKKGPPKLPDWPIPKVRSKTKPKAAKPVSVADIYRQFTGG